MLRWLGILPGEGRLFAWAAAALFLLGWADVSVKNVAETLFFKRVGVDKLPQVFLINSLLLVVTTYLVGRVAAKTDRLKLLPWSFVALALMLLPLWGLALENVTSSFALLMIASKQLQCIALLVFWVALADLLHGRQAKRLFALLMAGMTLGTTLGSFASDPISRVTGIAGLLPLAAVALIVGAGMTWPLRRLRSASLERGRGSMGSPANEVAESAKRRADGSMAGFRELWSENRLFRLLFVVTICSGLLGPMLYFQFSYVADIATQGAGAEQKLFAFYSKFRGWIGIGVLATQLGFASSLYRRIGIPLAAAISPLIYLLGFAGLSIRLSLPAGVGAMAGTKLQDNAIYDPAVRVLFNLFPEDIRSRAMVLLEGPVKRGGGALGNIVIMLAVGVGSAIWVGWLALPIAALWLVAALVLWRAYPALLMKVSSRRSQFGDDFDASDFLDSNTLRALSGYLLDPDPARCRVAADLVAEARPERAAAILAEALKSSPRTTQPILIAALDGVLEASVAEDVTEPAAARHLEDFLEGPSAISERDRADVVQAYGRLTAGVRSESDRVLARAQGDPSPAVRLAAAAALHLRGAPPQGLADLKGALRAGVIDENPTMRRTAREEYRALLLRSEPTEVWEGDLAEFAALQVPDSDRADVLEVIADVAERHRERAAGVADVVLQWRGDTDPKILAALIRFVGHTQLVEHAGWIVSHAAYAGGPEKDCVLNAVREAVEALGVGAADALLVELSFGRRSSREAVLPLLRLLHVEVASIRLIYEGELDSIRRKMVDLNAAVKAGVSPIIQQRLGERFDEGVHTTLQLLAAVYDDDRIAGLAAVLRRVRGSRRYAVLLEALESLLSPSEKGQLIPLLEDRSVAERGRSAARALGIEVPTGVGVIQKLLDSPDELTRTFAAATLGADADDGGGMAAGSDVQDDGGVLSPVERAMMLRGVPLFEGMTTRQLMDVAEVVVQEVHPPNTVVAREGDYSDCMYIIADGNVAITKGDTELNRIGANDFFGEIAVFEGTTRSANVVTLDEVHLLRLGRDDLLSLMEELPAIAICICQTLSRRVRRLTQRLHD